MRHEVRKHALELALEALPHDADIDLVMKTATRFYRFLWPYDRRPKRQAALSDAPLVAPVWTVGVEESGAE